VIGVSRVAAVCGAAALLWTAAGAQLPSHARLPVSGVVGGAVVSLPFGCTSFELEPYDPFCPGRHIHTGIDLAAATGTAVYSATPGTAHVGFDPNGAGRYVIVTVDAHARVFYCHLSTVAVANGEAVSAGKVVGAIGQTGLATGPHLHLEVQVDGRSVDPAAWLAH
jgi:murein DD-endopeptidase MepM/ murein hydrolase activator NlpD